MRYKTDRERGYEMEQIAKGIWEITFGVPEKYTPMYFLKKEIRKDDLQKVKISRQAVWNIDELRWRQSNRGIEIRLPMNTTEDIYGFGLQLQSINHAGRRRFIKVNSDPPADTGESHAPVPYYISTAGYGIYVDTYRYTTFSMGTNSKRGTSSSMITENEQHKEFSESALYALKRAKEEREIIIQIPSVKGIRIYFFEGNVQEVVQRYNLLSGGGCVPPMWGLGVWYRSYGGSSEQEVRNLGTMFRRERMPVDVLGLEPGWHSHSYSCTYKWSDLFPNHDEMIMEMKKEGYHLNLWEHLFVYPQAPFYQELLPYSGDYEVWNGLVPDFATQQARKLFAEYHAETFVRKGISGFKLDECDNSDYNPSNWSFPDVTEFPSGMDGEQMHMAIGSMYQNLINNIYQRENLRTYSEVRSSGALAAALPFVLYSDLYNHKQFIRGIVNAGFSGLLWCPEVRDCTNGDDLLRRIQTIIFSNQALVNGWRIPSPPWKQTDIKKNLAGEEMLTAEYYTEEVRKLFELRMSLLPYLYSAYMEYYRSGKPPIRALVMDYPEDKTVRLIDDQYLFGDSMLVCPLVYEEGTRKSVYLPHGTWHNYFTEDVLEGGAFYELSCEYNEMLVFVKTGTLIPVAKPVTFVDENTIFEVTAKLFGNQEASFTLYEDDFETYQFEHEQNQVVITRRPGETVQVIRTGHNRVRYHIRRD